jgi:hypothetical protein
MKYEKHGAHAVFSLCSSNLANQPFSLLGTLMRGMQAFHLVMVSLQPFLARLHHVLLGILDGREVPFALDKVAGLARAHKVLHISRASPGVGVNVVDRHDQPVFEPPLRIQSTVLALEVISLENLHRQITRNIGPGPKDESFDFRQRHGSSFRSLGRAVVGSFLASDRMSAENPAGALACSKAILTSIGREYSWNLEGHRSILISPLLPGRRTESLTVIMAPRSRVTVKS